MHIAVLGNPTSWYASDLERAANSRGNRCSRMEYTQLTADVFGADRPTEFRAGESDSSGIDAIVIRTMPPGSLEQIVFRMDVLARLEASGVIALNGPRAIELAVDKFLTTAELAAAGVPVPRTVVCEKAESAMQAFEELGGDVVAKPVFGAEGRGIVRVSDPDLAFRTFRTLERIQAVLYLQQYIDHGGSDIRALVFDGEILGGMRRFDPHDFRVNVSRRGSAEPHELTAHECELARLAAQATGTRFCGVDLLYGPDGRSYVIEVNAIPGWQAFQRVTGLDVATEIIRRLEIDVAR